MAHFAEVKIYWAGELRDRELQGFLGRGLHVIRHGVGRQGVEGGVWRGFAM